MPLVILNCKITGGTPKGMGRKLPAMTRTTLRATAWEWHARILERHFTPGNESRYGFDPRNAVYMSEIKKKKGVGGGRYVKELLSGQSLRWLRTFASVTGTQHQATLRMTAPTYFEHPFIGSFVDPKSGRLKHVTRQPDKPKEVTAVNDADRASLSKFAQADMNLRMQLAMRGI